MAVAKANLPLADDPVVIQAETGDVPFLDDFDEQVEVGRRVDDAGRFAVAEPDRHLCAPDGRGNIRRADRYDA